MRNRRILQSPHNGQTNYYALSSRPRAPELVARAFSPLWFPPSSPARRAKRNLFLPLPLFLGMQLRHDEETRTRGPTTTKEVSKEQLSSRPRKHQPFFGRSAFSQQAFRADPQPAKVLDRRCLVAKPRRQQQGRRRKHAAVVVVKDDEEEEALRASLVGGDGGGEGRRRCRRQ